MPIKDVHVFLDEEDHPERAAVNLATRFGAYLTALSVEEQPELTHYMEQAREAVRRKVAASRARFTALAREVGIAFSVVDLAVPVDGSIDEMLQHCRLSDLVVIDRASASDEFHSTLIRKLLLDSSAPVLIVPPGRARFERSAIAWDGRAGAAHAIHSAIPLLQRAETVTIVSVVSRLGGDHPGTDELARYLSHHGIAAARRSIVATGSVADALLAFVSEEGVDWITMGAFSHSRLNEFLFGSPTREMLAETTVPLLMHH